MSEPIVFPKEKAVYKAEVTNQSMTVDNKGVQALSVWVKLQGQLLDPFNANSPLIPLPISGGDQIEVRLRFDSSRTDTMQYTLDDLERLGYVGTDIAELHPEHPKAFVLKGKTVFVSPRMKITGGREATYWNFRTPKSIDESSCAIEDLTGSPAAEEFRRLMLGKNRPGTEIAVEANTGDTAPVKKGRKANATPF